ncbi:hypothetical protein [Pararhizobium sp.]|uniref:hypothetical protein n=1 Tax=Pararhizobium sp. TaxID=1977563 RepID=UPI003D0B386E
MNHLYLVCRLCNEYCRVSEEYDGSCRLMDTAEQCLPFFAATHADHHVDLVEAENLGMPDEAQWTMSNAEGRYRKGKERRANLQAGVCVI